MTTIYLIRHAEAEGNVYRRAHGQYDSLLTPNGERQCKALAGRFAKIHLDAVYSSDLFRARRTAEAVARPRNLPLTLLPALREIDMGDWEDRTWGELYLWEPEQMDCFSNRPTQWKVPRAEAFEAVRERLFAAFREIVRAHPEQSIAIVSHGMALRALFSVLKQLSCADMAELPHSDNTAVTILKAEGPEAVSFLAMGDNSHLDAETSTFANQSWWRKGIRGFGDVDLWFQVLDLNREAAFFAECRRDAWKLIHGSLKDYHETGFLAEAARESTRDPRTVCAAMLGGKRAGLLQLAPPDELGVARIPFFYLLPELRRRGLGVQLIGQSTSVCRSMGATRLLLHCASDNHPALRLYARYGFEQTGRVPGVRVPLWVLEKPIEVPPAEDGAFSV